jgi:hypothetical protein
MPICLRQVRSSASSDALGLYLPRACELSRARRFFAFSVRFHALLLFSLLLMTKWRSGTVTLDGSPLYAA